MKAEVLTKPVELELASKASVSRFHPSSFILYPFSGCVLLYAAGLLISSLVAGGSFWHIAGMIAGITVFWLLLALIMFAKNGRAALYWAGLVITLGLSVIGVMTLPHLDDDYLRTNDLSGKAIDLVRPFVPRLEWLVMHRNTLAGMLTVFGTLALAYTLFGPRWWARLLGALASLVMLGTLLITNSRSGLVTLGVGLVLLGLLAWRGFPRLRLWLAGFGLTVAGVAGAYLAVSGQYRLFSPERLLNENGIGRLELWGKTFYLLGDVPLTGLGPGRFQAIYPFYLDASRVGGVDYQEHAHNLFLQTYADTGLIGFVAIVWAVALWAWLFWKVMRGRFNTELANEPVRFTLIAGSLATFGALLAEGLVEHSAWNGQFAPFFWVPLALAGGALEPARFNLTVFTRTVSATPERVKANFSSRPWRTSLVGLLTLVVLVVAGWQLWGFGQVNSASLEKLKVWQGQVNEASLEHSRQLYQNAEAAVGWTGVPERSQGWIALWKNEPGIAETYLRQALDRDPKDQLSHLLLGDALAGQGRTTAAITVWQQAKAAPRLTSRGQRLLDTPNDSAAEPYLLDAIQVDPRWWDGYGFLVTLYQRHYRTPEAIVLLEKAHQYLPDDPRPLQELAKLK